MELAKTKNQKEKETENNQSQWAKCDVLQSQTHSNKDSHKDAKRFLPSHNTVLLFGHAFHGGSDGNEKG